MAKYALVPFAFSLGGQNLVVDPAHAYDDADPIVVEWPNLFSDVPPEQ